MNYTINLMRRDLWGGLFAVAAALACGSCAVEIDDSEAVDEPVGEASLAIAASCNVNATGTNLWISPNGNDLNPGTFSQPMKTLQAVNDKWINTPPATIKYTIHVDGGLYRAQEVRWSFLSPSRHITIEPCPGAVPIFDGLSSTSDSEPEAFFFQIKPAQDGPTNLTLKNLTIRNYFQHGVVLNPGSGDFKTSNNTIEGCTLENIGSALWPEREGVSAINCARSSNNHFINNRFVAIEDKPDESAQLHAIYCAHGSSENIIEQNSFDRCSGDPIKFRDGSNDNKVRNNSFNRCGDNAIINQWRNNSWVCDKPEGAYDSQSECNAKCDEVCVKVYEDYSTGNVAEANIVTFPHPDADRDPLLECLDDSGECPADHMEFKPDNFLVFSEPSDEKVAAIVGGDFDGNGRDEILVAFNYDGQEGFSKIMSTAGSVDNRYLHRAIYANDRWNVNAMTSCDCNDNGDLELLTALEFVDGVDWIYSGDGETHRVGLGSSIYSSSYWEVTAMAGGDYDGNGDDELITTFQASNKTRIYSGDGTTSPTNIATLLDDDTAPYWKITAQAAGNFNGGSDAIVTAMNAVNSSSGSYKVYSGNGVTSATNTTLHSDTTSPYWRTTATVAGDFNDDGTEELITGMYLPGASPSYKLYIGNGTSNVDGASLLSSSTAFFVPAVGGADYNADGNLDLITAINTPGTSPALRILVGNGATSHDNLATLYSSTYMD